MSLCDWQPQNDADCSDQKVDPSWRLSSTSGAKQARRKYECVNNCCSKTAKGSVDHKMVHFCCSIGCCVNTTIVSRNTPTLETIEAVFTPNDENAAFLNYLNRVNALNSQKCPRTVGYKNYTGRHNSIFTGTHTLILHHNLRIGV